MTSKKLGALLRSVPPATAIPEQPTPVVQLPTPAELAEQSPHRQARPTTAVEPEVPLQVLIPASVRKQLALKAAEEGQSLRALMLLAIRSLGITVTDVQIKGKRGSRT
jgi:hypothetical protein